ncbi:MAG: DNRLRE domain-containing protein [Candidatus Bathyarchaeota archaeon]|nr:DNRLRE domain-containing protein [Candidatus Bathyarchaeota archaeon]
MKKPKTIALLMPLLLLIGALTPYFAHAGYEYIGADNDAYVDMNKAQTNYGGAEYIYINATCNGLIHFAVDFIPSGAVVTSATLNLYFKEVEHGGSIYVYRITKSWWEGSVKWSNQPPHETSATASATVAAGDVGWVTWDVTAEVQEFVSGAKKNFGWKLITDDGNVTVRTKEQSSNCPTLEVAFRSIESCDAEGNEKDIFQLTDDVWATGEGFEASTSYPIYVVSDAAWTDGMHIPDSVSGTISTVYTEENGVIMRQTPVWNHPLTPGKYDIVIDVNSNGVYDSGIDVLDDNDIQVTAGFFVIPEYAFGALISLAACFAAFAVFKSRLNLLHPKLC